MAKLYKIFVDNFYPLFNLNQSQLYKNDLLISQKKWQIMRTHFVNNSLDHAGT